MDEQKSAEWSNEEIRLLRHESFIAEIEKLRHPAKEESPSKPTWQRFLESAGAAALLTALLGGLGATLNYFVQEKMKEREMLLASYQQELKDEQALGTTIADLVGRSVATSEDLLMLTSTPFNPDRFSGEQRDRVVSQRTQLRTTYNQVDAEWRMSREKLRLLVGLHSHGRAEAVAAWATAEEDLNGYRHCVEDWYDDWVDEKRAYSTTVEARNACQPLKDKLKKSLDAFALELERTWGQAVRHR
jgi:hypothetical protein